MRAWLALLLIALGTAAAQAFGRFSFSVLLPAIRDDLQISNTLAGSIAAANVGAYLLGTLAVAWATTKFRLLTALRLGMIFVSLGLVIAANAHSPLVLGIALFVTGIGGAFVWIPAPVIAADAMPKAQRSLAVGLIGSGIGLGIVFNGFISGYLRDAAGDAAWVTVYQIQAGIALAALVGTLIVVRHPQSPTIGKNGFGGFTALRRMQGWRPFTLAYGTFGFMYLLVIGFLTTRLEDDSEWTTTAAAFALTIMGIAMIFGGPLLIAVANRIGPRLTLVGAFSSWVLLVLAVVTGWYALTLVAVVGLGLLFSGIPSLMTLYVVENTTASDYGPSFAAATLAFGLAQMFSPQLGGLIADISGSFTLVFFLSSCMGVLGALASLKLPRPGPL